MRRDSSQINTEEVERCRKTGKKKSSRHQAKKEARYLKYNEKFPGIMPNSYKCSHCGWYHVGNKTEW